MHHQQFLEVLAFHLFEALPAHFCKREFGIEQHLGGVSVLSQDFLGKIFRPENPCLFQDVGPFDDIFQFTYITGPIVLLERLDDKRVNRAAETAGITTRQLHKLLTKYSIRKEAFKPPKVNKKQPSGEAL